MSRLLSWPKGVCPKEATPLSGPRSTGSSGNETQTGFVQTRSSPFGLWRWQFTFSPMVDSKARRVRGMITALHGGANAVRVSWFDGNGLKPQLWGVSGYAPEPVWSNGMRRSVSAPLVPVTFASSRGDIYIYLGSGLWRDNLECGDMIGFVPFHFGWYMVTENMGAGRFRIWPPLRSDISTSSFATLNPTIVMRLESESSATYKMGAFISSDISMTMVEVEDAYVRSRLYD